MHLKWTVIIWTNCGILRKFLKTLLIFYWIFYFNLNFKNILTHRVNHKYNFSNIQTCTWIFLDNFKTLNVIFLIFENEILLKLKLITWKNQKNMFKKLEKNHYIQLNDAQVWQHLKLKFKQINSNEITF